MNTGALLNRVNLGAQVGANQISNISISAWAPGQRLSAMDADRQVDGVVEALLGGDASPETRRAMLSVQSSSGTPQHIGELVAIALGSSDFQRR
jgi:hypothetical protein